MKNILTVLILLIASIASGQMFSNNYVVNTPPYYVVIDGIAYDFYHKPTPLEVDSMRDAHCNHFFVLQATPEKDSIIVVDHTMYIDSEPYIYVDTIRVKAQKPCICIYCNKVQKCF